MRRHTVLPLFGIVSLLTLPQLTAAETEKKTKKDPTPPAKLAPLDWSKRMAVPRDEMGLAMPGYPMLEKNGKMEYVSVKEYIEHHLKGVKTKYHAIAVPDG